MKVTASQFQLDLFSSVLILSLTGSKLLLNLSIEFLMSVAIFSIFKSSIWLYRFLFFKSSCSFSWCLLLFHGFYSNYILNYFKHTYFYLYYPEFLQLKFLIVYYCCLLSVLTLTGGMLFSLCFEFYIVNSSAPFRTLQLGISYSLD